MPSQKTKKKRFQVTGRIIKKIFKLKLKKTNYVAELSKKLNMPYYRVRSIVNGDLDDIQNDEIESPENEFSSDHVNAVSLFHQSFPSFQDQNFTIV